ncbi:sigma factor-like helix-turn-helix DNA-binding protein [Terrabacter sp. BE26]|uniref:sigma factor-like helix-turn-helix DNA-binding protein n=1 Tax=Terrabacter sp. BE26 TaxID=2898152 RepID=UPI0035BE9C0F
MRGIDADFAGYVRARQLQLLRGAWLVTGDHARAEEVVLRVLTGLARRWRHLPERSPDAFVRARVHRDSMLVAEDVARTGTRPSPDVPILVGLTARESAVLVLRCLEGRSVDETAEALGLTGHRVSEAERAGRDRLTRSAVVAAGMAGRVAAIGPARSDGEVRALLEEASAGVREAELAERAWQQMLLARSTVRRRLLTAAVAATLGGAGIWAAGRGPAATGVSGSAAYTGLPGLTGMGSAATAGLTPVPQAAEAVWHTTIDGLKYAVAPTAGTEASQPWLDTGIAPLIDPSRPHQLASSHQPSGLDALGDAVYLEERGPGRWVPVVVWGDGQLFTLDTVSLTSLRTGTGQPPLDVWAFSADKTSLAFPQPGGVVVVDVATRSAHEVAIPSPDLQWAGWLGGYLRAGSAEGTWSPGLSPRWPAPDPPRRPGAREFRVEKGQAVLDQHSPDASARAIPVGWPRLHPVGDTVSDATQYASAFALESGEARGLQAVSPRTVIVATTQVGYERMLVFGEEQPRDRTCCTVLGWTVRGELLYLSVAPSGTWIMGWDVETGIVHRVTHFLTSPSVPAVIALGARFTVG